MISLRPIQAPEVQKIREAFVHGAMRVLYTAPTGFGKTILFAYISTQSLIKGKRVLILEHRRELIEQTSRALQGVPHRIIAPGFSVHLEFPLQIASIQTLSVRGLVLPPFDLVVVDEAHHSSSRTWAALLSRFAVRVLGVTATPCRLSGRGLGDLFEVLIQGPTIRYLQTVGLLAPCDVWAPGVVDTKELKVKGGDYRQEDVDKIVNQPQIIGNVVETYRKLAWGLPAIFFCASVDHSKKVAARFQEAGIKALHLDGMTSTWARDAAINGFREGKLQAIMSCSLIEEGLDVPTAIYCGDLSPTKSLSRCLQRWGRILRPGDGKRAIIADHTGNALRHGLPDQDREWTLDKGLISRNSEKSDVLVRRCPECFYVHFWAKVCPNCGHEYQPTPREIAEREGELIRLEKMADRKARGRARTLEELREFGKKKGYKPGWAYRVWTARGQK